VGELGKGFGGRGASVRWVPRERKESEGGASGRDGEGGCHEGGSVGMVARRGWHRARGTRQRWPCPAPKRLGWAGVERHTSRGKPKGERRRGRWLLGGPAGECGPYTS
jgi:hypothetical protein